MRPRWYTVPLIVAVIMIGWQIITAGHSFTHVDGEEAWDLWTGREKILVLDVSDQRDFVRAHVPGAVHMELGELRDNIREMDRDQPVLVMSTDRGRGVQAAHMLVVAGFSRIYHLQGGLAEWPGPLEGEGR